MWNVKFPYLFLNWFFRKKKILKKYSLYIQITFKFQKGSFVLDHLAPSMDFFRMIKAILFLHLSLETIQTNICHFSLTYHTSCLAFTPTHNPTPVSVIPVPGYTMCASNHSEYSNAPFSPTPPNNHKRENIFRSFFSFSLKNSIENVSSFWIVYRNFVKESSLVESVKKCPLCL